MKKLNLITIFVLLHVNLTLGATYVLDLGWQDIQFTNSMALGETATLEIRNNGGAASAGIMVYLTDRTKSVLALCTNLTDGTVTNSSVGTLNLATTNLAGKFTDAGPHAEKTFSLTVWDATANRMLASAPIVIRNNPIADEIMNGWTNIPAEVQNELEASIQGISELATEASETAQEALDAVEEIELGSGFVATNDPTYTTTVALAESALQSESDPLWAANSNAVVRTTDSRLTDSRNPLAHTQGWHSITGVPYTATHLWVDSATNYHAALANNASTYSSTSFSATLMWAITNSGDPPVIELGPTAIGAGLGERTYEIDAPIMVGGGQGIGGFTLRGQGNLGSHVTIKTNYTGRLFVLTNMVSISRFESIRFADNLLTANTNPVIHSEITELVVMDCEFTGFLGGAIRHHPSFFSAWNKIQDSWFVRTRASEAPSIDLLTTESTTFIDFQISDCHFWQQAGGTNADIRITGPRSAYAQIHGNRFYSANTTATNGTIVELAGGFGASVNDNVFIVRDTGTTPIRFTAATSNNYRAIVSGNNFAPNSTSPVAYGVNTNAVVVGANSHDIAIVGNKLGAAEVRVASGATGVFQLNTTSDIPASASTWWQYPAESDVDIQGNSLLNVANLVGTNNSIYTDTVAKAASALQSVPWGEATTNNMTNINWGALGGSVGLTNNQTGVSLGGTFTGEHVGNGASLTNLTDATARASIIAMGDAIHPRILANVTNGTATLWASSSAWWRVNCDTNALTNWVIDTTGVSAGDTVAMAIEIYRPNANTWAWMPGVTNSSPATNATTLNCFVLISGTTNWLVNP